MSLNELYLLDAAATDIITFICFHTFEMYIADTFGLVKGKSGTGSTSSVPESPKTIKITNMKKRAVKNEDDSG